MSVALLNWRKLKHAHTQTGTKYATKGKFS